MRRCSELIKRASERGKRLNALSQKSKLNARIEAALNFVPEADYLVFELDTHNPRTGIKHYLEIWHEAYGQNNRYSVYVDGEKWRNGWSRTRFCKWIFRQIDSVVRRYD